MKKLFLLCGLLWAAAASAQFTPGQVLTAAELNSQFALYAPLTGASFSGLVSVPGLTATGTVSFPTASLPLPYLATQTANTIVSNASGIVASPTAVSVPSCSTSSSALQWTSGTGFACNTAIAASTAATATNATQLGGVAAASYLTSASAAGTYAPLASPTFTGTTSAAALTVTGNLTPSQTAGIVGTTTNNNANAGSVGEYLSNTGTAVSLTSASPTTVATITLTAGDWDVWGAAQYVPAGTTVIANQVIGINTANSLPASITQEGNTTGTKAAGQGDIINISPFRVTLTGSQSYNLVVQGSFSISTCTATGTIQARRRR